jgi:thiamine-monophosphate kinase
MNPKDLLAIATPNQFPSRRKLTVISVCGATGRRFRMKQESQLVEKILRALSSSRDSKIRSRGIVSSKNFRQRLSSTLRLGPGDDAAILSPSGESDLVLSCDAFIENVHFRMKTHPPDSVGYKSLARATSDLAAMGATPRYFLLTIALPKPLSGQWLDGLRKGMARASRELGIAIIGGDTTVAAAVSISITVIGEVEAGAAVSRSGAVPGDLIYVSGILGGAQLGLDLVLGGEALNPKFRSLVQPHLYPTIQIELGSWLAKNRIPTAMMDISDGLSTDLARLCRASEVGAHIYANKIPQVTISAAAAKILSRHKINPLVMALHGGEDYGLLFTVPPRNLSKLRNAPGFPSLTAIGKITNARKVLLADASGRAKLLAARGWDPFSKE